jgi:hypothetical protein
MADRRKLKAVEQYGTQYVEEYLAKARKDHGSITTEPLAALAFMLGKFFARGRRDSVSIDFRNKTLGLLDTYKTLQSIELGDLDARLHQRGVNNRYDRRMVVASIRFARMQLQAYDCNVFNWAVAAIRDEQVEEAYRALDDIFAVGDKLATFYLRDIALVEGIEGGIATDDYGFFQPVDTWVERVAESLGIITEHDRGRRPTVKGKIIKSCLATDVSPLLFNAGAWMVGANAYRLLIEKL